MPAGCRRGATTCDHETDFPLLRHPGPGRTGAGRARARAGAISSRPTRAGGRAWRARGQRPAESRRGRQHRQPPGPDPARDARLGDRHQPRADRGARRARHAGNRPRHRRRGQCLAARLGRLGELPRFLGFAGQPVVQRHFGAVRRGRRASDRQLDLRPRRSHRRAVQLPVRRGRGGRRHQLRDQGGAARYVLRRPAAPGFVRRAPGIRGP
ncbi:Uncharacterised protein [Bordetella pertussis]|nr:Uncharacterised protein [Bordetella pertussis]